MCKYDIFLERQAVGYAQLEKQGLYYRIQCSCNLPAPGPYRIEAASADRSIDLGICVRQDSEFTLVKRVPIKQLAEEPLSFRVITGESKQEGDFYPVKEDAPFDQLGFLMNARLCNRDGQTGVIILPESLQ